MHETEGILPFIGSGTQRTKNRIIEELVPGDADAFPSKILSQLERCTLHFAISNTINEYKSKNTNSMCQEIGNREKLTGNILLMQLNLKSSSDNIIFIGRTISFNAIDCPREYGVILTPYGTIAPGAVIGAIAASLQHQNVILNQLLATPAITFTSISLQYYFL